MEPPRAGEIERMALDADRLRSALGWRDAVALEEGLGAHLGVGSTSAARRPGPPSPTL